MKGLIQQLETIAGEEFDGHYTILAFTTNFRVAFGTPWHHEQYLEVPAFSTLEEAVRNAVETKVSFLV
jgi:hypothetical protein